MTECVPGVYRLSCLCCLGGGPSIELLPHPERPSMSLRVIQRLKANTHQRGGGGGGEQVNTHQRGGGGGGGGEQGCGQCCDGRKHYELCILSLNYYI